MLRRNLKAFVLALFVAAIACGFAAATIKTASIAHPILRYNASGVTVAGFVELREESQHTDRIVIRVERIEGNRSPISSPLMDAIVDWVGEHDAGADVVPVILPGFTDSRHFREAFPDCVAYGFFPQKHQTLFETQPLIHAADERIDARDLAFATEFFRDLALRMLDPRSA